MIGGVLVVDSSLLITSTSPEPPLIELPQSALVATDVVDATGGPFIADAVHPQTRSSNDRIVENIDECIIFSCDRLLCLDDDRLMLPLILFITW